MFDIDKFIQECDSRIEKKNNHKAVIDILSKAVENTTDLFNILVNQRRVEFKKYISQISFRYLMLFGLQI